MWEINSILVVTLIALITLILVVYYLQSTLFRRNGKRTKNASVLVVVGSGGHTKEILTLMSGLSKKYSPRYYVVAATDYISEEKVHQFEMTKEDNNKDDLKYTIHKIPRSREVKQSWVSTVLTTIRAIMSSIPIVFTLNPDVILCNGPGTCIPICFAGILLKMLRFGGVKIIYVESICRVQTLSLSAKLLYYVADEMLVQWECLQTKYPRTKYIGRVV